MAETPARDVVIELEIATELLDRIEAIARDRLGDRSMPIPPECAMVLIGAYREHLERKLQIDWNHIAKHGLAACTPEHTWAEWLDDRNDEITGLTRELAEAREALAECEEYFSERADADQPAGCDSPIPNDEMRMLVKVQAIRDRSSKEDGA